MVGEPDIRLTVDGDPVDVYISCYGIRPFGEERPKFSLTVSLVFPNGWERFVKADWNYRGDWFYRYKTHVGVELRLGSLTAGRKRLPTNWVVTIDAFKYVDGSGAVCNKTYPDTCRFLKRQVLVDAVVQMFEDDPGLYPRLVARDFDEKVAHQRKQVADAEGRLKREREELDATIAYAERFRPKGVPQDASGGDAT